MTTKPKHGCAREGAAVKTTNREREMSKYEVIEVIYQGNSGAHQHGFVRYARISLSCGCSSKIKYWQAGDRQNGRPVIEDTVYMGQERECPKCSNRKENLLMQRVPKSDAGEHIVATEIYSHYHCLNRPNKHLIAYSSYYEVFE